MELVTGDASGLVRIWDIRNFKCVQSMVSHTFVCAHASAVCPAPVIVYRAMQSHEGFDQKYHQMTGVVTATTAQKRVILAGPRLHALYAESVNDPVTTAQTSVAGVCFSDASMTFCAATGTSYKVCLVQFDDCPGGTCSQWSYDSMVLVGVGR